MSEGRIERIVRIEEIRGIRRIRGIGGITGISRTGLPGLLVKLVCLPGTAFPGLVFLGGVFPPLCSKGGARNRYRLVSVPRAAAGPLPLPETPAALR